MMSSCNDYLRTARRLKRAYSTLSWLFLSLCIISLAFCSNAIAQPSQVPETNGSTYNDAVRYLRRLDVGIEKRDEESSTVSAGLVIRTEPPANSPFDRSITKTVTVYVSKGWPKGELTPPGTTTPGAPPPSTTASEVPPPARKVQVPPFKPQPHERVVAVLKKAGFRVEETRSEPSNLPAGYFTRTEPPAGAWIPYGADEQQRVDAG